MADQIITLRLTSDAAGVVTGANLAGDAVRGIGGAAEQTSRRTTSALDSMKSQVMAVAAAWISMRGVMTLGRIADEAANMRAKLVLVTGSTQALAEAQREVYAISQDTSTSLQATTKLYARLSSALEELGVSQQQVAGLTRTINQALVVSGASAVEADSAILQLSQAFASGRLAGEEFNAVNEAAPRLMEALARSMGVTRGELKQLAADGKITSATLVQAFSGPEAARIANEAAQIPITFGRAFTQLRNALTRYIGEADQAYSISSTLAGVIAQMAQNVGPLTTGIIGITGAITAWYAASLLAAKGLALTSTAMTGLGLVVAGVALGSILADEFKQVRAAGAALLVGLNNVWTAIKGGAQTAFIGIKVAWFTIVDEIENRLADLIEKFTGLAQFEIGGVRADFTYGQADSLNALARSLRESTDAGAIAKNEFRALNKELRKGEADAMAFADGMFEGVDAHFAARDASDEHRNRLEALNDSTLRTAGAQGELGDAAERTGRRARKTAGDVDTLREAMQRAQGASSTLGGILSDQAAQLGGPLVSAALRYRDSLVAIAEAERDLMSIGPLTVEQQAQIDEARRNAALVYEQSQQDILADQDELTRRSREAADEYADGWMSGIDRVADAFGQWITSGSRSIKDFARMLVDIATQSTANWASSLLRGASGGGGILGSLGGLFGGGSGGSALGSGAFAGATASAGVRPGLGLGGSSGGLFNSQLLTGLITGIQGIRSGSVPQGLIGGAQVGSVFGTAGSIIGGIIGGLSALINGKKPPDFRLGGDSSNVRKPEGQFSTVFGTVRAGSREISWESLQQPVQQFDATIQQLVASIGGGQEQLDEIRAALARWSVDLKGDAATAENILGSRFSAILQTFDQNIIDFVGSAGTVEQRVQRLSDALSIQAFADAGQLSDDFGQLAGILERNRAGTEAIADTYARVVGSVNLLDQALQLSGVTLDQSRLEHIDFAASIAEAAGGLERAASLWDGYFARFYTDEERRAANLAGARTRAALEFTQAGLNFSDFEGDGGAARFRALFEQALPTLSADAIVQWLEAADALGAVIDLQATFNTVINDTVSTLTGLGDLMAQVEDEIAGFAPAQTFAQRLGTIGKDIELLVAQAQRLGASEEDIARIRYLGQLRLNAVLEEQQAALSEYQGFIAGFAPDAAAGLSEFQAALRQIATDEAGAVEQANALARAAGMAGAAEGDLALIHMRSAEAAAEAAAQLEASILSLSEQLGYAAQAAAEATAPDGALGFVHWLEQQRNAQQQAEQVDPQRYGLAVRLAGQLRELSEFTGDALTETMARLRVPLDRLIADFGVNLDNLGNAEVFDRLAGAARVLGIEITDAARELGVQVGDLSDATALINDAFERALGRLPDEVQGTIRPLLAAYESAATPQARADARQALVDAVDELPPSLRAALAPFLDEIDTTSLQEQQVSIGEQTNRYLSASVDHLAAIRAGVTGGGSLQPGGIVGASGIQITTIASGQKALAAGQSETTREIRALRGSFDELSRNISLFLDRTARGVTA